MTRAGDQQLLRAARDWRASAESACCAVDLSADACIEVRCWFPFCGDPRYGDTRFFEITAGAQVVGWTEIASQFVDIEHVARRIAPDGWRHVYRVTDREGRERWYFTRTVCHA